MLIKIVNDCKILFYVKFLYRLQKHVYVVRSIGMEPIWKIDQIKWKNIPKEKIGTDFRLTKILQTFLTDSAGEIVPWLTPLGMWLMPALTSNN